MKKLDFSFVSAQRASFMKIWQLLRDWGLHILNWEKNLIGIYCYIYDELHYISNCFIKIINLQEIIRRNIKVNFKNNTASTSWLSTVVIHRDNWLVFSLTHSCWLRRCCFRRRCSLCHTIWSAVYQKIVNFRRCNCVLNVALVLLFNWTEAVVFI